MRKLCAVPLPLAYLMSGAAPPPPSCKKGISALLVLYHNKVSKHGCDTPLGSTPNMTGRPGCRTTEMNGGSSASYLACTPCIPLLCTLFIRGGNRGACRLPGEGGDHFHCTPEPSPGHIPRKGGLCEEGGVSWIGPLRLRFKNTTSIVLHRNRLSCLLPSCNNQSVSISIVATDLESCHLVTLAIVLQQREA